MSENSGEIKSDIEIAREANLLPIQNVAQQCGIPEGSFNVFGKFQAKISMDYYSSMDKSPKGKLVLVSSINPTPPGEGKTTMTIGLGDALNRIGKRTTICLREPSLGPCFGMKGGATGGGYAQIAPMEDINLHFTGDNYAVSTAHNLLAAAIDNHIHHQNRLGIDPRRIFWKRVIDMNDRALRDIVIGLGGTGNSFPRETGFEITVASEVMAILCLSESLLELKERLGKIIIGYSLSGKRVTAADLNVHGAMTVILKNAIMPNLVQTLENTPAFVHGGPFANIAHGCNSTIATKLSMKLSEYTVTEAGFGADLGAEKFLNIKCRQADICPDVVVLVVTLRALKYHGGISLKKVGRQNMQALEDGLENLKKHIENIHAFGLPVVVGLNVFSKDRENEMRLVQEKISYLGVEVVLSDHWKRGGEGAEMLARTVVDVVETKNRNFKFLYPNSMSLWEKSRIIAREIYGANQIMADKSLRTKFSRLQEEGFGDLSICMAKTQYSLSTDPRLRGRPKDFNVPLRDIHIAAGAGFAVVSTGDIMTMPGLPRVPSAESIDFDEKGQTIGLF